MMTLHVVYIPPYMEANDLHVQVYKQCSSSSWKPSGTYTLECRVHNKIDISDQIGCSSLIGLTTR